MYESFGGNGERVLGFAMRPMPRTIEQEEAADPEYKEKLKQGLIGGGTDRLFILFRPFLTRPNLPAACCIFSKSVIMCS